MFLCQVPMEIHQVEGTEEHIQIQTHDGQVEHVQVQSGEEQQVSRCTNE